MGENETGIQHYNEPFIPFKVDTDKLLHDLELLEDGEACHVGHAATIIQIGNQRISLDPVIQGNELEINGKKLFPGRLFPPVGMDSLKIVKTGNYDHNLVDTRDAVLADLSPEITNINVVGEALGSGVNSVFISHLDPDHLDIELISSMIDGNPDLKVYGPKGIIRWVEKANLNNPKLENVLGHIQELSPNIVYADDSLNTTDSKSYEKVELGDGTKATVFEIVHEGSKKAEVTQAFLFENGGTRVLSCPEAALSPEIINVLKKVHSSETPLSSIILSTAIYNPDKFHELLPENITKHYKDSVEEFTAHSAFLPFVFMALTDGEVPIELVHHGFYYKDRAEKRNIPYRIPITQDANVKPQEWISEFKELLVNIEEQLKFRLKPLKPTSFPSTSIAERLKHLKTRSTFSASIRAWIAENPVPSTLLDTINLPQGGETISQINQPSGGKIIPNEH